MSAQTSFHADFGGTIKAHSTRTSGAPLTIEFRGRDGERVGAAIFFTDDQAYTDRLIEAINGVELLAAQSIETTEAAS